MSLRQRFEDVCERLDRLEKAVERLDANVTMLVIYARDQAKERAAHQAVERDEARISKLPEDDKG